MPIYVYKCESCTKEEELIQSFNNPIPPICEACGHPMTRTIQAATPVFTGSGFYQTDYKPSHKAE